MTAAAISSVMELLRQLQSVPEGALKNLGQRMHYVREVLSARYLPPIEEFTANLTPALLGIPKPTQVVPLREDWVKRLLEVEVRAWRRWQIELPKSLTRLFYETLGEMSRENAALLQAYGFRFCLLPNLMFQEDDTFLANWSKPDPQYWQWLREGRLFTERGFPARVCGIEAGVYLVDSRRKPSHVRLRWEDDLLFEALIARRLAQVQQKGHQSRFYMDRGDWNALAEAFQQILIELGCSQTNPSRPRFGLPHVRLETLPEWITLCRYKHGSNWLRGGEGPEHSYVRLHETLGSSPHDYGLGGGMSGEGDEAKAQYGLSHVCPFVPWDTSESRSTGRLIAILAFDRLE